LDFFQVLDAMFGPNRNKYRMIFVQFLNRFITADFCRAFDNDPMLCTMKLRLKGQSGFGLYVNALDLKAIPNHQALEPAPGAVVFKKGAGLVAFLAFRASTAF
jgi:hypothetical protein